MNIKNKVVFVTGSSSGIGQATAIVCAQHGAQVLIHFRKNKTGADATLKEVKKYSQGSIFQADLSQADAVQELFAQINKKYSTIDILVNNAGEFQAGEFNDVDLWQSQFQTNLMSIVYTVNEFLNINNSTNLRKIINISSAYGFLDTGIPSGMQYCAAKAALNSLTINLAKKLAPTVLVNAVAPGYTWTPNWEGTSQEDMQRVTSLTKIQRYITPEEIASMVLELVKNDGITGEVIRVDGGLHLPDIL